MSVDSISWWNKVQDAITVTGWALFYMK